MMERELPKAFTDSRDYSELTAKQKKGLAADLQYIENIVKDIHDWLDTDSLELEPRYFFDELELDILVAHAVPDEDKGVSPWLIRSAWGRDVPLELLKQQLSAEVGLAINAAPPKLEDDIQDYKRWLRLQSEALQSSLDLFYAGKTFASTIAYRIALDAILSNILAGLIRFRLTIKEPSH